MTMILGAAVAAGGVFIINMSNNVEKGIRVISDREKYLKLNDLLTKGINDSIICTSALSGKNIANAFTPSGVSLLPFTMNLLGTSQTINGSWKSPEFLKIRDVRLYITEPDLKTGIRRDVSGAPVLNAVNGLIRIFAEKGTPAINRPRHDILNPKVMVYYESVGASRILYACFSSIGEGALCTLGGGVFNTYAPIGDRPRCEPFAKCLLDEQGVIDAAGSCSAPYLKIRISPDGYVCQWCNQNL